MQRKKGCMTAGSAFESVRQELSQLDPATEAYAAGFVDRLLQSAYRLGASDVHLRPTPEGLEVAIRIDGVLQPCGVFPSGKVSDVIVRLKILSDLLTYKT